VVQAAAVDHIRLPQRVLAVQMVQMAVMAFTAKELDKALPLDILVMLVERYMPEVVAVAEVRITAQFQAVLVVQAAAEMAGQLVAQAVQHP
jgi:hypothetical protein